MLPCILYFRCIFFDVFCTYVFSCWGLQRFQVAYLPDIRGTWKQVWPDGACYEGCRGCFRVFGLPGRWRVWGFSPAVLKKAEMFYKDDDDRDDDDDDDDNNDDVCIATSFVRCPEKDASPYAPSYF